MSINYSELGEIVKRAKASGLIWQRRGRRTGRKSVYPSDHPSISKIACPACGAAKGEHCKPTVGLSEDTPVHASRIHDAERA